ncbi:P-loop containing nucleoside triphosphate hydrolase protein [Nemania sp. FL0031]|nr:P-loop containing nucleoside triphosphate hydrolase protein [Nemania sp. FL0031]
MQVLYDFLKPYYEKNVLPYLEQLQQLSSECLFSFDKLCFVFKPGMDVYVQAGDSIKAMVVVGIKCNLDYNFEAEAKLTQTELQYWNLELWYLASDGENIGRQPTSCRIDSFQGLKQLIDLEACPASVWDAHDGGAQRKRLMQRGRLLFKALQNGHLLADYRGPVKGGAKHYSGPMIVDIRRGMVFSKLQPPQFGHVMEGPHSPRIFEGYDNIYVYDVKNEVDDSWTPPYHYEGDAHTPSNQRTVESLTWSNDPRYNFLQPNTPQPNIPQRNIPQGNILQGNNLQVNIPEPGISWNSSGQIPYESHNISYWSKKTKRPLRGNLTDHQFLLLCPATLAFALKTKQWVTIQPDYITEVEPSNESLDHLVLGPSELSTIKALATRQNSKRDIWAADFIEGKGTGQIILLHGPPGVGKTYTVEAIAQYLHRPLLALTVADIGTLETRVEQELLKWFSLAEAWDAILLVDEADIFLERRQNRDLARNAFLRRMEYFKGLLFLTTNRVGHIDDAFISRIHVAIGYESFSPESRSQIWKGFFRKLSEERAGKIQIAQGAKKWVLDKALSGTAQLNGRDIRNALQTAITLAEAEYEEDPEFNPDTTTIVVDQSHFKRVLGITNKFRAYVESIRREDEKKRAAGRHDRNDYWEDEQNTGARP